APVAQNQAKSADSCELFPKGDADCSGTIDLYDFKIWLVPYKAGAYEPTADFNLDQIVDLGDFIIWKINYAG
ncbi:MAG: hypothetical protein ACMG6E_10030, partial [Candidatus Roizmanbacteria bacterium]